MFSWRYGGECATWKFGDTAKQAQVGGIQLGKQKTILHMLLRFCAMSGLPSACFTWPVIADWFLKGIAAIPQKSIRFLLGYSAIQPCCTRFSGCKDSPIEAIVNGNRKEIDICGGGVKTNPFGCAS